MPFSLTTIPDGFGSGGSGLAPNRNAGTPTLVELLQELQTQLSRLSDVTATNGANLIGVQATGGTLEAALAAVTATANAGMAVVKRTCTINYAPAGDNFAALAGGVKTYSKNIGAATQADARLVGWTIGEGTPVLFDDATHGNFGLEIGTAGDADSIMTSTSIKAGATTLPGKGTAGVDGFDMRSIASTQFIAKLTGSVDLNTVTAGSVVVNLFYLVLA